MGSPRIKVQVPPRPPPRVVRAHRLRRLTISVAVDSASVLGGSDGVRDPWLDDFRARQGATRHWWRLALSNVGSARFGVADAGESGMGGDGRCAPSMPPSGA